ncbi:hypothetical protein [Streptomyces sp. NPDC090022]|uniref:hypothetical protein n=1 Tax=Streptomyces sp. NPDC090022 TaxID=3365920 RepID=UPI00380FBA4F
MTSLPTRTRTRLRKRAAGERGGRAAVAAAGAAAGATAGATAVAVALAGALLSGCGIKPTSAVEAGAPATVSVPVGPETAFVYFLSPEGRLMPAARRSTLPMPASEVLYRLLRGPTDEDRAAGLHTELPPVDTVAGASWGVETIDPATMRVRLYFPVGPLSWPARRQLVCTVAHAARPGQDTEVVLTGPDGDLDAERCRL